MVAASKRQPAEQSERVIRDKAFPKRLVSACDDNTKVPQYNYGRQTWIKNKLGELYGVSVSHETVRKWFSGEARPRVQKMKALAALLEVDEAWLSLGSKPDLEPRDRERRNATVNGAVNLFTGFLQLNGGHPAFIESTDPNSEFADLYAIVKGKQFLIHVSLADNRSGTTVMRVPTQHERCLVVGVVPEAPFECSLIRMPSELILKHAKRARGSLQLSLERRGREYSSGGDRWPRLRDISDML